MAIKAVIFDYGCVLSMPQDPEAFARLAGILGVDETVLFAPYWRHREAYDRSEMNAEGFWRTIADESGVPLDGRLVPRLVHIDNASWLRLNPQMMRWPQRLQSAGVKTAILSNMPPDLRAHLATGAEWLRFFDVHVFSCDIGYTKPHPNIYTHCLRQLIINPEEALFIDDRQPNVDGAVALGIRSHLFLNERDAALELEPLCRPQT